MKDLDLHGLTVEEALRAMDHLVDECRMKGGEHEVHIITGHGKIRDALALYFKENQLSYRFEYGNNGAYWVMID